MHRHKLFALILTLLCPLFSNASWEEDFKLLGQIPRSYEDTGAICEELARLNMQKDYPQEKYEIIVGIEYGDLSKTIGELDLVIFDRATKEIAVVGEVKCWRNFEGGLRKAKEQRLRFFTNINSKKSLHFQSVVTQESYDAKLFENVRTFITIGQKGATDHGYTKELDYDFKQLRRFSMELLRCQDSGECAYPTY